MGNSNSVDWKLPDQSVAMFHEAMNWIERNQHENGIMYDDETIKDYLENKIKEFIIEPSNHSTEDKESLITNQVIKSPRPPTASIIINSILSPVAAFAVSGQMTIEDSYQSTSKNTAFMDSSYHQNWLSKQDADKIFNHLYEEGKHMHAQMKSMQVKNPNIKYPLSTLTYGAKRILDGALALDRWGSYHESWCRVMEPTDEISKLCDTMRTYFHLPSYALNSVVVNYYWDGSSTHIPAHQDTVACLDDNSSIYCLSLGATREFALCSISDSGQYHKQNLHIANLWSLSHGDLFALGPQTNQSFGHVVPQDKSVDKLRISIIFRTVIKSFIDLSPTVRNRRVKYANGTEKRFQAECVLSTSLSDAGTRTHLCDLIHQREERKKAQLLAKLRAQERNIQAKPVTTSLLDTEDPKKYFRGHGQHVPMVTNSDTSTTDTTVTTVTTTKSISNQRVSYDTFEGRPETTDINRPVFTLMKPNSSRVNSIRSPRAIYSRNHIQTDNTNKIKYYVSESDANERTSYLLDSCETVTTSRPQIHGKVEKPALLRWLQTSQRILE